MFPTSGVIGTGSFRCSRTSLATRSNSRTLAVVSRWARPRAITRSSSGLRIRDVASRPRTCPGSLTDSGKPPELGVKAPGSGSQSPRASSKLTAVESGSRAARAGGPPSLSRFRQSPRMRLHPRLEWFDGANCLHQRHSRSVSFNGGHVARPCKEIHDAAPRRGVSRKRSPVSSFCSWRHKA